MDVMSCDTTKKTQGTRNDSVQTTDLPELWQPLQFSRKCERAHVIRRDLVAGAMHASRAQQDGHTAQGDSVSRNSNDMAARATPIRLNPHKKKSHEETCGRGESTRHASVCTRCTRRQQTTTKGETSITTRLGKWRCSNTG